VLLRHFLHFRRLQLPRTAARSMIFGASAFTEIAFFGDLTVALRPRSSRVRITGSWTKVMLPVARCDQV
jgi:hypothetical protein